MFPSWGVQQAEVAGHVAAVAASLLHRAQLCQAPLGEMVPGVLLHRHHLDRRPLLRHGVDGRSRVPLTPCWRAGGFGGSGHVIREVNVSRSGDRHRLHSGNP